MTRNNTLINTRSLSFLEPAHTYILNMFSVFFNHSRLIWTDLACVTVNHDNNVSIQIGYKFFKMMRLSLTCP